MVGRLCKNVDGFYSYYRPVTVTSSAVACLASDPSSYRIYINPWLSLSTITVRGWTPSSL